MSIYKTFKINPLILVFLIGSLHLWFMWPGILSPDSQGQYAMAVAGIYNDHHPPLMSFVWRYLDHIVPGSGMMFLLHLSLLYGSIFYLISSFCNFRYRFILLLFSLIPQIFFYSNMIWKDIGFTFSFLFVAAYLSYLSSNKQQPTWYKIIILVIILLYGTAVKFQAQFCAPVLLGWLAYVCSNYQIYCKKFIKTVSILLLLFYFVLNSINYVLIPNVQKNYSWQLVKLYDLAAISVAINKDLFPDFTKNNNFTMQELQSRFNRKPLDQFKYYMVDDLIFGDAILKTGSNKIERQQLYFSWVKTIFRHPLIYLKHRAINMASMLLYHPSFKYINNFLNNNNYNNSMVYWIANGMVYLTMANLIPAILSVIYLILGILVLRSTFWAAVPLICFNAVSIIMLVVLFFCSMAGTPRYTYITICMVHASHVLAYLCWRKKREISYC